MAEEELKGIGGWLLLLAFGFYIQVGFHFAFMILTPLLFWKQIYFVIAIYHIYLLVLMYLKSRHFKVAAIISLWIWAVLYLLGAEVYGGLGITFITSVAGTLYLLNSRRVKNTFQDTRKKVKKK